MEFTYLQSLFIYISSILFLTLFSYFYSKSKKKYLLLIGSIPLLTLATLRNNVGTDYLNYYYMFENYKSITLIDLLQSKNIEIGYWLLNKVAIYFNSFNLLLFLSATIILFVPILTVKDDDYICFPLFVLFYSSTYIVGFNIIRQSIAISILFRAIYNFVKFKNMKKYLVYNLIAFSFHSTSIIFIPLFLLINSGYHLKSTFIRYIVIFVTVAVAINPSIVFNVISNISFLERFSTYDKINSSNNYTFYLNLIIFISLFLIRKKFNNLTDSSNYFLLLSFISLVLGFIGFRMVYVKRIASYFSIFTTLLISLIPNIFIKKDRMFISVILMFYSLIMFYISYGVYGFSNIIPYRI